MDAHEPVIQLIDENGTVVREWDFIQNYGFGGHLIVTAGPDGWLYADTGEPYDRTSPRPCLKCGLHQTEEGRAPCVGPLPAGVRDISCGYGIQGNGFIRFFNGAILRCTIHEVEHHHPRNGLIDRVHLSDSQWPLTERLTE